MSYQCGCGRYFMDWEQAEAQRKKWFKWQTDQFKEKDE